MRSRATSLAAGGQAIYTDRPTITYVPLTGEKFLHGLITPIDPKNIFFMLQSGYAADFILAPDRRVAQRRPQSFDRRRHGAGGGPGVRARAGAAARSAGGRRGRDARGGGQGQGLDRRAVLPARRPAGRHRGEGGGNPAVAQAARRPAEVRAHLFAGARGGGRAGREQPFHAADHGGLRELPRRAGGAPEGSQRDAGFRARRPGGPAGRGADLTAARTSRPTPSPPCVTATTGSGSTTATGRRSARSRRSCSSSRSRRPAATRSCR